MLKGGVVKKSMLRWGVPYVVVYNVNKCKCMSEVGEPHQYWDCGFEKLHFYLLKLHFYLLKLHFYLLKTTFLLILGAKTTFLLIKTSLLWCSFYVILHYGNVV